MIIMCVTAYSVQYTYTTFTVRFKSLAPNLIIAFSIE